jgi:hypothetical protein
MEQELNSLMAQTSDQYLALNRLHKKIQDTNTLLKSHIQRASNFEKEKLETENLKASFEVLFRDRLQDIWFDGANLFAMTKPVYIPYKEKIYNIGEFEILISLNGTFRLTNRTRKIESCDHPHVRQGMPCLGNTAEALPKMVFQGDYLGALMVLIDYLHSYNPGGEYGGAALINWPIVKEREIICEKCKINVKSCECPKQASSVIVEEGTEEITPSQEA